MMDKNNVLFFPSLGFFSLLSKILMRHILDQINEHPKGSVTIVLLWMSVSILSYGNTKCRCLLIFSRNTY